MSETCPLKPHFWYDELYAYEFGLSCLIYLSILLADSVHCPCRFRLAQLHVDELLRLEFPEDITERLKTLPNGLKEAYDNIYLHLKEERSEREFLIVVRAILWMLALKQPPTSRFLVQAVRIDPVIYMKRTLKHPHESPETQDEDYVLSYRDEATLLKLCTNLWTLSSLNQWQFCHASVSEYFQEAHFSTLQAHAHASCVSTLVLIDVMRSINTGHLFGAAKPSGISQDALLNLDSSLLHQELPLTDEIIAWEDKSPEVFEDGRLFAYAVQNWMHHIPRIEKSSKDQADHMDLDSYDSSPALMTRTSVMFLLQRFLGPPNDSSPAYRF